MTRANTLSVSFLSVLMLVGAWLLPSQVFAQTGDDALRFADRMPGSTTWSMGLAGTGVAGVADASAFVTNPAGLGWLQRSVGAGSFTMLTSKTEGVYHSPGYSSSLSDELTKAGVSNLSYLFKVPTTQGSMTIGAALSRSTTYERGLSFDGDNGSNSITDFFMPFGNEFSLVEDGGEVFPEFNRTLSFIAYETYAIDLDQGLIDAGEPVPFLPAVSFGTVAQSGVFEDTGSLMELNFGGAVEVAPDVMVGASMNIPVGTFERFRSIEEDDYLNDNDGTGGTTDFNYLYFSERFTSDLVGVNGRFGVSARANENVRIGLSIETPTYFAIGESYSTYLETEFDYGDFFSYGDGPGQDAGSGSFDYTLRTPWRLGLGSQFNLGLISISTDMEWIDWSQTEFNASRFDFSDVNRDIRDALQSVVNVRVGASVDVGNTELRAGFAVHPDPRTEQRFVAEEFPNVDRERAYGSLGIGYRFSDKLMIDAAWMAETFKDRSDLYVDVSGAPYVLEDVTRHRFQIGLRFAM
ncbi:MAG: hypothetical protein OXT73_05330 [Bacteroidota bacterium]|nr:hypothetical protein [Bacteroidota bacterium]